MSGQIWTKDARSATAVRTDDVDTAAWTALCDLATTNDIDPESTDTLTLMFSSAATWLAFFASPGGENWSWDTGAVEALTRFLKVDQMLADLLRAPLAEQAAWPANIPAPSDLGVRRQLTDSQMRDTARLLSIQGGASFGVPGSGKTTSALTVYAGLRHVGVVSQMLVLAPLSAHEAWTTEVVDVFHSDKRPTLAVKPKAIDSEIVVFNYEALESTSVMREVMLWCQSAPTMVVFDEAHRVKAGQTGVRGAAAQVVARAATRRLVLTGTPRPNSAADLENIFELAFPGRGVWVARGVDVPTRHAFVRTTKSELDLPDLKTKTEQVPMSPAHDRVYQAIIDAAATAVVADPSILEDVTRAGRIAMLLMQTTTDPTAVIGIRGELNMTEDLPGLDLDVLLASLPVSFTPTKLVRAVQLVDERAAAGQKVVVWACFKSHIARLSTLLHHHQPAVVTGDIPVADRSRPTDREREIERFRTDPRCSVLIATPHTLAEGVSLHRTTTHQIHLDRPYNAAMFLQSLDRTHRLGLAPDTDCTVTYLCATQLDGSETVDHDVARALDRKVTEMSRVLDDPDLLDLAIPETNDNVPLPEVLFDQGANEMLAQMLSRRRQQ